MNLVRVIIMACTVLMGSTAATARTNSADSGPVTPVISAVPASYSTMAVGTATFMQYAKGLLALRGDQKHVTKAYVERLVKEARAVVGKPGNTWMPVHILLGIAVMETDLRWWLKRGYGVVADCGLTQINLTSIYRMSRYKKFKLCRALTAKGTGTKLSMEWTMREMNKIKQKYCNATWLARINRYHGSWTWQGKLSSKQKFWRCMLAVYNQGPRFITYKHNTCTFKRRFIEDPSQAYLNKLAAKCRNRNRYWLRAWCFSEGVRLGRKPTYAVRRWTTKGCKPEQKRGCWRVVKYRRASCRHAYSMSWIKARYK